MKRSSTSRNAVALTFAAPAPRFRAFAPVVYFKICRIGSGINFVPNFQHAWQPLQS